VTIGLEIVFLEVADVGTEHFAVGGAVIAAIVGFIIPFIYTRRNSSLWGHIELARIFDGPKFSGGSKKLRSKYEEGQEVSEDELKLLPTKFLTCEKCQTVYRFIGNQLYQVAI